MTNVLASENEFPIIRILEDPTPPTTPASGVYYVYVDEGTKTLHGVDDTGADIDYGDAGSGLSDQDAFTFLDATEAAAPATPAAGFVRIYAKSDGRVYSKDDAGVEYGPFDVAGGAGLTFPAIATASGGNRTTDSTTQTLDMPASVASGDLLIAILVCDGNPTFTWPAGWTSLHTGTVSGGSAAKVEARYRVADGSEGASMAVTTSASEMMAYNVVRITGYQGTPESSTGATGSSTTLTSDSLNPAGWGTEATLWLAVGAYDVGQSFATSNDLMVTAGTTNGPNQRSDNANGVGLVIHAHTEARASLVAPPAVISTSRVWRAFTIGVRPA
jgi:hypothetical protein